MPSSVVNKPIAARRLPAGSRASFLGRGLKVPPRLQPSGISRRRAAATTSANIHWLPVAGAAVGGMLAGLAVARWAQRYFRGEINETRAASENARLRAKVEELQQVVGKYEPLAYKDLRLRFTRGVNKAVILGLVDELLANKEVNIWWLPDSLERIFYFNVISLMLSVLDEMVEGISINFAGHNVKLQLTYLDLEGQTGTKVSKIELVPA